MALQTALFYRTLSTYRPVQNRRFDESSRYSAEELAAFDPDVTFEKVQIVHAPQAHFMDLHWDTILGVVAGDNYKVSAQWTDPLAEVGKRRAVAHGVVYEALREGDGEEHDSMGLLSR